MKKLRKYKNYPETYDEALKLLCDAMIILDCKTLKEYEEKNRFGDFPSFYYLKKHFSIKMSEVTKIIHPERAKYELLFPTRKSLVELVGKYFKDTEDTLSIVNFDSWYGRDISKYIMKAFGLTWNQFKLFMVSVYPAYEYKIINNSRGGRIL